MKPVYLFTLATLLIVSSFAVATKKKATYSVSGTVSSSKSQIEIGLNPLPVLGASSTFPEFTAEGILAQDADSGVFLYEKNPDTRLYPASTTKIMTALVALDYYKSDDIIKVGRINAIGQSMRLVEGEEITFNSLLHALLMYSANDAAEALAQSYSGGRDAFINAMNQKAIELHLDNTHFANPSGLDEDGHYSTAKDMIRLSEIAMQNGYFAQIVGTKEMIVKSVDNKFVHYLKNINELLGTVDGVKGVKTGWTEGARENLITYIERNGRKVYIAILGSQDRFGETKKMINWIFGSYNWQDIQPSN